MVSSSSFFVLSDQFGRCPLGSGFFFAYIVRMKNKITLGIIVLVALIFGAFIYTKMGVFTAKPAVQNGPVSGVIDPPAPFPSLALGDVILPVPQAKGYTLVNLFASWCAPCLAEWPHLQALAKLDNLHMVGLGFASDTGIDAFLAKNDNPFDAVGLDSNGDLLSRLNASGLPETYLLNPQGQIIFHRTGALLDDDVAHIQKAILH